LQDVFRRLCTGRVARLVETDGELRAALGLLQPRTGTPVRTGQHGAGTTRAVLDSCRLAVEAAVAELCQQPGERRYRAGLHRRVRKRPWKDAEDQFRASAPCGVPAGREVRAADRLWPFLRRLREPRRQSEPGIQLSLP